MERLFFQDLQDAPNKNTTNNSAIPANTLNIALKAGHFILALAIMATLLTIIVSPFILVGKIAVTTPSVKNAISDVTHITSEEAKQPNIQIVSGYEKTSGVIHAGSSS